MDKVYIKCRARITSADMNLFILAVITGLLVHLPMYSSHITNPDTRMMAGGYRYKSTYWEVALGRWALYLIDCMRGYLASPYVATFISIIIMSISGILLVKVLHISGKVNSVIIVMMMMVMPCFSYTLSYWYCSDGYAYAMLLSILAVYMMKKENIQSFFIGVMCLAVMLGLYQAYLGVTVGLCMISLLLELLSQGYKREKWLKSVLRYACMGILGMAVYWGILQIALKIWNTSLSTYSGADNIGILNSIYYFPKRFIRTYYDFFQWMFGEEIIYNAYWKRQWIWAAIFIVLMILLLYKAICDKNIEKILLGSIVTVLLPPALNIIEIAAPERNINILLSGSMCLLIPFVLKLSEDIKIGKKDGGGRHNGNFFTGYCLVLYSSG